MQCRQETHRRVACGGRRDGVRGLGLTCLLHQGQDHKGPRQGPAPALGTHPEGRHGGGQVARREWGAKLAPLGALGLI